MGDITTTTTNTGLANSVLKHLTHDATLTIFAQDLFITNNLPFKASKSMIVGQFSTHANGRVDWPAVSIIKQFQHIFK